jgi:pyrroline-5-carboxylate reductase
MAKIIKNFYFIGFGNMAEAIYRRMDKKSYDNIFLIEKSDGRRKKLIEWPFAKATVMKELGKVTFNDDDVILLAVKPNQIKTICSQLKSILSKNGLPLIISIAAGVTTIKLKKYLDATHNYLIRAMPNLCAKKGMAITGLFGDPIYFGKKGGTLQGKKVSKIFSSIGQILFVDKELDLDVVTAISGSGPAYIFYIMNALIDMAEELGLNRSDAQMLVAQTIIGSGETGKNINDLEGEINKVSSKGGTTEKAIDVFKLKKLDVIIKQAVKAAHKRSKELSK